MEKPVRRSLLPGVRDAGTPPAIVFQSRVIIARARRRALLRDALDLVLLFCVDGLFLGWPRTHLPLLDRHDSLMALATINALMFLVLSLTRSVPRWRARRVAQTWGPAERARFRR